MLESASRDTASGVDEIDRARAQEYALLATLLSRSPDRELLSGLARLQGDASPIGMAHAALGEAAMRTNEESVGREYFALFSGLGGGSLLPYASHYLTGALYGRPLVRLRETLRRLGDFFETHLSPWIRKFFVDLERAEPADFYARVGALGRTFVDVEAEAFAHV
jgi:TorA maturation chaperone TorD